MRGAFGLVSLLVCALIIAYVWATHTQKTAEVGAKAMDEARQLSGHSDDGTPVDKSFTTEPQNDANRHLKSLLVTDVVQGGGMQTYYGLQKGDRIRVIGPLEVSTLDDAGMMQAMMVDAFEKKQQLTVIRNGQEIILPLGSGSSSSPQPPSISNPPATPAPAAPAPSPAGPKNIQDQLNGILKNGQQ